MAENEKAESQEMESEDPGKELDSKINVAVRAQLQRALKPLNEQMGVLKNLDSMITSALEKALPKKEKTEEKAEGKSNPEVKLLQEQFEKMQKKLQESEERAQTLEKTSKKEKTRALLKEALEAKGVKGVRAAALISHFEASGMVQEDEDGKPVIEVTRARSKGASPEALLFDIGAGIEDWSKTADAADFLPAPGTGKTAAPPTQSRGTGVQKAAPKFDRPPVSDDEAVRRTVQQLEAQGVNILAAIDGE